MECCLLTALLLSVVAFGGTEIFTASLAELLIILAGMLALFERRPAALDVPWRNLWVPFLLIAFVCVQLLPLGGEGRIISLDPAATREQLLRLVACITAFAVGRRVCASRASAKRLVVALLILGGLESIHGLVQSLTRWPQIFTYVNEFSRGSATGTYINHNHFAGFLEMLLPLALGMCFLEAGRIADRARVFLWSGLAAILLAALVASRSRMGIAAGLGGLILSGLLLARMQQRRSLRIATAGLAAGAVLAAWIGVGPVMRRYEALVGMQRTNPVSRGVDEGGLEGRVSFWRGSMELIRQKPWLGSGLGTFEWAYAARQRLFVTLRVEHAHNDFLQAAVELGVPAATLLFGAVGPVLWRVVRSAAAQHVEGRADPFTRALGPACAGSIAALLLHGLTDFNLYVPANALVFAALLGLASSLATAHTETAGAPEM